MNIRWLVFCLIVLSSLNACSHGEKVQKVDVENKQEEKRTDELEVDKKSTQEKDEMKITFDEKKEGAAKVGEIEIVSEPINFLDYFPLEQNVSYVTTNGKDSWFSTFEGKKIVDGNEVFVESTAFVLNETMDEPVYNLYAINDNDELLSVGSSKSNGKTTWKVNPTVKSPITIELNKDYVYVEDDSILKTTVTLNYKGLVDVEVSDRTFEDCLLLEKIHVIENPNENQSEIISKEYYSKGIGLINYEHEYIWTDFKKKETNHHFDLMYYLHMGSPNF